MGKPAARIGDMHTCPMVSGTVPHVGGPVMGPAVPTVLIGGMPAAVMGDMCTCVGPPDSIIMGSTGVFIGRKPAARMGDPTTHGGIIVVGNPTVLIGEVAPGTFSPIGPLLLKAALAQVNPSSSLQAAQIMAMKEAARDGKPFCAVCAKVAEAAKKAWDYISHTSLNLGGDFEVTAGARISAKASILGAGAGAAVDASSVKLFGAEGKLGASMAEGFKKPDGEISWIGRDRTYEVSQELAGQAGIELGATHTGKYKKGEKAEHSGSVTVGPVEIARDKDEGNITDSASYELIGLDLAFILGVKISVTASLEHENQT